MTLIKPLLIVSSLALSCLLAIVYTIVSVSQPSSYFIGEPNGQYQELGQQLGMYSGYWFILLLVGVTISGLAARREICLFFNRRSRGSLSAIAGTGALLLLLVVHRGNRLYYDEQIYQQIAQHYAFTGELFNASYAETEFGDYRAFKTSYSKQPQGHPFLMGVFFRVFGVGELVAHLVNNFWYLLGILSIFLLSRTWFNSLSISLLAATYWALTPMVLVWANTTSSDLPAAAVVVAAMATASLFSFHKTMNTASLWVFSTALAGGFRPETILVIPTTIVMLLMDKELRKGKLLLWAIVLLALLSLPNLLHFFAVKHQDWGAENRPKFSLEYYRDNLAVNFAFLYDNLRYPTMISALALIGLWNFDHLRAKVVLGLWFSWSWGLFLFFYAGSYNYGQDVRFSVSWAGIAAILAAIGTLKVSNFVEQFCPRLNFKLLLSVLLLFVFVSYWPLLRSTGLESNQSRRDVTFVKKTVGKMPHRSLVISYVPSTWLINGVDSISLDHVENNVMIIQDYARQYKGGVYLHFDYWCEPQEGARRETCNNLLNNFPNHSLFSQFPDTEPLHFALYKLLPSM